MNVESKVDFTRLIKNYLAEISSIGKTSILKNAIYSIRSFFRENESEIIFHFNNKTKRTRNQPTISLTLEKLEKILTVKNIQPIEKAVFICKFQRGLDNSTFADRFNFEIWEQLVEHFGSAKPRSWNIKNTPVSIRLERVKTGFVHTGFLDFDAIIAIAEYLKTRYNAPEIDKALFIDRAKKPITVNWILRRFHKLVARADLQNLTGGKTTNQCTSHEMRDLLKSTLIDSNCRPDIADHVIGHAPKDSYEKQTILYPESLLYEFVKASARINILSNYSGQKQHNTGAHVKTQKTLYIKPSEEFKKIYKHILIQEKRIIQLEQYIIK